VREDYSENGDAWNYTNHDTAEAKHTDGEKKESAGSVMTFKTCFFSWILEQKR
jgi:hypothetical protein